jgi:DNA-binding MarR family transcriptional regulator
MDFETGTIISLIARIREKAHRFIMNELKGHGLVGLAPVHGDVLMALFFHNELTMKQIADIVDRKKSTVTTLVEKLVRLGYAKKVKDPEDHRSFRISLTRKGRGLKDRLIDISMKLQLKVYKDMPMRERRQLVKSLRTINDNW